jgi:hypothetical protein
VRSSRASLWVTLIAMSLTLLSQIGTGFRRPINVMVGCGSGVLLLFAVVMLYRTRRHKHSDVSQP